MSSPSSPDTPAETQVRRPRGAVLRHRILESARRTFLDEGFDASMDAVAASAGTTKATVYKHFGNKEALMIAVVEDGLDQALAEPTRLVRSRLARSTRMREDLAEACRALVDGLATPEMIKLRNLVAGEHLKFPELGEAWKKRGPERLHAAIVEALRGLVEQRRLSIDDLDLAVGQLSGLVLSPHLVYGAYGDPVDSTMRENLITSGVDMFLDYYRHRTNA